MNQYNWDAIWLLGEEADKVDIQFFDLSRPLRKAVDSILGFCPRYY